MPLKIRLETVLFWVIPVTFGPMTPVITVALADWPSLLSDPVKFMDAPERVVFPVPCNDLIDTFPVPVKLPVKLNAWVLLAFCEIVRLLAKVIRPEIVVWFDPPVRIIDRVPLEPDATLIALVGFTLEPNPMAAALEPLESPKVTAPVPKALDPPTPKKPCFTLTPPVKVLAPLNCQLPVPVLTTLRVVPAPSEITPSAARTELVIVPAP